VSLSLINSYGSVPLDYQLYLPEEWTEDRARCRKAGVPEEIEFRTKAQIAHEQIERALADNVPRGIVLADAGYGTESDFRDWLQSQASGKCDRRLSATFTSLSFARNRLR
jgi:SRSO17 transposase